MISRRGTVVMLGASAIGASAPAKALVRSKFRAAAGARSKTDPLFKEPYIDIDEWRDAPVRHRYVHGGFKGTNARFVFYFPPKERYQGRFFHYVSPVPVPETQVLESFWGGSILPFAFDSGAYAVGTNQGGTGATATPTDHTDPTIAAFRVNAAAAEYSRILASEMYGGHRAYGYVFGGSGGAFRTIGGFENTDAWDGAVPFVMGSPMHIPNVFTVRAHATRLLKGKTQQIVDALEAGGSGDVYAGLNDDQRAALSEATRMGLPLQAWWFENEGEMGLGAFTILFGLVKMSDPSYFQDFWKVPGYLGANPPQSLIDDRVQHKASVRRVVTSAEAASLGLPAPAMGPRVDAASAWKNLERQMGGVVPVALELDAPPTRGDLRLGEIAVKTGAAAGQQLLLNGMRGRYAILGVSPLAAPTKVANAIRQGDQVLIDNSDFLASQTYHRHQVPGPDYHAWDQFRRPDGSPIYPQRPRLLGPEFTISAAGALPKARFKGKMIVVECLMDFDAFPWGADWYRQKLRENLGPKYAEQYRLWFVERAIHGDPPHPGLYAISYTPVLQQALRDLSAWVEQDVSAPASTSYERVEDSQIAVPASAAERKGIQPVVTLKANGTALAEVGVGQPVIFEAQAEVPPHAGKLVSAEWDFEGTGASPTPAHVVVAERIQVRATHSFARPGTYFPTLRVTSQREGDPATPFARIQNLARARVVVR